MLNGKLFDTGPDRDRAFDAARARIEREVGAVPEDEFLAMEFEPWADDLADEAGVEVPRLRAEEYVVANLGPRTIDCTGWAGIQYYPARESQVLRPGYAFQVRIPVDGPAHLFRTRTRTGEAGIDGDIDDNAVVRTWEWPEVWGPERFNGEVENYVAKVAGAARATVNNIEEFNDTLRAYALQTMQARNSRLRVQREFLGGLRLPLKAAPDAPQSFAAPPIKERKTPARELTTARKPPVSAPDMSEFYEHILEIVRAVGRGLERSPGSFEDAGEETLRDHMLVTLNTHYVGRTHAEAFGVPPL